MSGFFNETNAGRITKMHDMLRGPMLKSAASNRATPEQWAVMLAPVRKFIDEMTGHTPEPALIAEMSAPDPSPTKRAGSAPRVHLKDLIDEAPFEELAAIITLCAHRIDMAAYELSKAEKETMK